MTGPLSHKTEEVIVDFSEPHILIVEDEPKISDILQDYLRQQGSFNTYQLFRGGRGDGAHTKASTEVDSA